MVFFVTIGAGLIALVLHVLRVPLFGDIVSVPVTALIAMCLVGVSGRLSPRTRRLLTAIVPCSIPNPGFVVWASAACELAAAIGLLEVELPEPTDPEPPSVTGLAPAAKREVILTEAIELFAARGFRDVTIEDIANAADLPASGVYRHFPSKVAILEASFWRATDRVTSAISDALAASTTPRAGSVRSGGLANHTVPPSGVGTVLQ